MLPKPTDDDAWVTLPGAGSMNTRDRFIMRAALLYPGILDWQTINNKRQPRVVKSFHAALQSCPLPPGALRDPHGYKPKREDVFPHLAYCRLQGDRLPLDLVDFLP